MEDKLVIKLGFVIANLIALTGVAGGQENLCGWRCLTEPAPKTESKSKSLGAASVQQTRTFRIAVAASGEYTEFHGGTVSSASGAVTTAVNRISGIYERELGVRLLLVTNNHLLIFTNKNTDPFSTNSASLTTIQEAQATFDQVIGSANYDLGILFNTGLYGLSFIRSVCHPSKKGSACMGLPEPDGERFHIYAAHEIAHQFGANHTFNSNSGMCGGARNEWTAVEPGAGSTLMSYAGLPCADDSWQPLQDDYFHAESLNEIFAFLESSEATCAIVSNITNRVPSVNAGPDFTIPKATPFILTATGSDPDADELLYCWEEMDIGPAQTLGEPDNGFSPVFRSFPPTTNAFRVFPQMSDVLANRQSPGERLPATNRGLHFRVVARDHANTGAFASSETHISVIGAAGPFRVTSHDRSSAFFGQQTVTWDVAGTTNAPISVSHVNILLSTNSGSHFSIALATNTPNDGSATVMFPEIDCTNARVKIEAVGNIFFDINDADLSLDPPLQFTSIVISENQLVLRWIYRAGKSYRLEATGDFNNPIWEEVPSNPTPEGNEMVVQFPFSQTRQFFRVREL